MRKNDREFLLENLKDSSSIICLKRGCSTVWISSKSYGLEIEKTRLNDGQTEILDKYTVDGIEEVIDSLMVEFKGYSLNKEYSIY